MFARVLSLCRCRANNSLVNCVWSTFCMPSAGEWKQAAEEEGEEEGGGLFKAGAVKLPSQEP